MKIEKETAQNISKFQSLFQLLLDPQVGIVTTFSFPAVSGAGMQTSIALPADHLLAVVFGGQRPHAGLDDTCKPNINY